MKVAIVCGAKNTEFLAPFDDEKYEIWVLGNRLDRFLDRKLRVTRVFEIHDYLDNHPDPEGYVKWLAEKRIPMVVGERFPAKADHIEIFDYEESEELYGSVYLTSSPAYMVSYALSHGATEIQIYGVDLSIDDHEYFWQRPCMESWIGFAKGRGVKVVIPEQSHIGKSSYCEGRDWQGKSPDGEKLSGGPFTEKQFLDLAKQHAEKIKEKREEYIANINAHTGAQQTYERLAKVARAISNGDRVELLSDTTILK